MLGEMRYQQGKAGQHGGWRWWSLLALGLLLAGCGGGTSSVSQATPTPTRAATPVLAATATPLAITPVPGDYSLYIDPTWAYTFAYPTNWIVYPQTGSQESNVIISEPYSPDPDHAMVRLLVRVTNNFRDSYVAQYLCHQQTSTTVAGYDAVDLTATGGDPNVGYSAMVLGRGFFAKGLAFEIWLQGSQKSYQTFVDNYQAVFQRVIASFDVGNGTTTHVGCA